MRNQRAGRLAMKPHTFRSILKMHHYMDRKVGDLDPFDLHVAYEFLHQRP